MEATSSKTDEYNFLYESFKVIKCCTSTLALFNIILDTRFSYIHVCFSFFKTVQRYKGTIKIITCNNRSRIANVEEPCNAVCIQQGGQTQQLTSYLKYLNHMASLQAAVMGTTTVQTHLVGREKTLNQGPPD